MKIKSNVLFGFDQSGLSEDAKINPDKLVRVPDSYKDTNIEIQGHTDRTGGKLSGKFVKQNIHIIVISDEFTVTRITVKLFNT